MRNTVIRVTPFGGFDIPGLENWLARMAAKGLRFSSSAGPLTRFARVPAETVQVHLEPVQGTPEEDPELNALYEAAGWQYWGMFRDSFFVYAFSDLQTQAHTDLETLDYALGRFWRHKLAAGLALAVGNLLLLGLYRRGAPWETDYGYWLRYFPVETLSNGAVLPFLLSALGLLLLDLSYLTGLFQLARYRRVVRTGKQTKRAYRTGWLLAVGWLILLPVLVNTAQLVSGWSYRPLELSGSVFVTLNDIEGKDFVVSRRELYGMDYISHGGSLLRPEYWSFRQYGSFGQEESPDSVPHMYLSAVRYPLELLAQMRATEWSRQRFNGSGDYIALEPAYGLDAVLYASREGWATGAGQDRLPGGILILRRGTTVLFADYYGEQDLSDYVEDFARMMSGL